MKSRLYVGRLSFTRFEPVRHRFAVPLFFLALDLDELPHLGAQVRLLSYNRRNLFAIRDRDFLHMHGSLRDRVLRLAREHGVEGDLAHVELLTVPRYLRCPYNPVNYFYVYRPDGGVACVVAELNNLLHERRIHVLREFQGEPGRFPLRAQCPHDFRFSPFDGAGGALEFSLSALGLDMSLQMSLVREGRPMLVAELGGRSFPLTASNLLRALGQRPLNAWLTRLEMKLARAWLERVRRVPVAPRPAGPDTTTIRGTSPGFLREAALNSVEDYLAGLQKGRLRLLLPSGSVIESGARDGEALEMSVAAHDFFWRFVRDGDAGLGETWVEGLWDTPDLPALLRLLRDNADALNDREIAFGLPGRLYNRARRGLRKRLVKDSTRTIEDQAEPGPGFHESFLDAGMNHSCGLYLQPGDTLEQAQQNKIAAVIRKAQAEAGHHVLEIGCGWGSLTLELARAAGCRVTGITLSSDQSMAAREKAKAAGLEDRVKIGLCDYRELQGRYDRIVCLEKDEAFGEGYLPAFFRNSDRLLADDGRAVVQMIVVPDRPYNPYRHSVDWLEKHIFSGGVIPSMTAVERAMKKHSRLAVEDAEEISAHYIRTLRDWRTRFESHLPGLEAMGFSDEFLRICQYYFCYAEVAFEAGALKCFQLVLRKAAQA